MKRSQPRRDWSDAQVKRTYCRVCGDWGPVELAHVIGRSHDRPKHPGRKTLWVDPDSVVPLCQEHHALYDSHRLDLLGHLTPEEEAKAVLDAGGLELARRRLAPSLYGRSTGGARAA